MATTPAAPIGTYEPGSGWNINGTLYSSALDAADIAARAGSDPDTVDALFVAQLPAINAALPNGVAVYGKPGVGYSYTCEQCRIRTGFLNRFRWASTAHSQAAAHVATHKKAAPLPRRERATRIQDAIDRRTRKAAPASSSTA